MQKKPVYVYPTAGKLQFKTDLHLTRKVWHMSMGLLIAFLYFSGIVPSAQMGVFILSLVLLLNLAIEFFRLRYTDFNRAVIQFFKPIMRSTETNEMSGIPYYLFAAILVIGIFPKDIAILSILYLACGDPVASLFGVLYGHRSIRLCPDRTLIGTVAGTITCLVISFIYLRGVKIPENYIPLLTVMGGVAGGTAELLPLDTNDNFTIPLISGLALWIGFIFLGI